MAEKKTNRPAIAAAVSMLSLSLGVSGAEAQTQPGGAPQSNPQGVLIGLNKPGASDQIKGEQYKSQQWKSDQLKSQQYKSDQLKSQQWKSDQLKSSQYKAQ